MTLRLTFKLWTEIVMIAACIFLFGMAEGKRRALREMQPRITEQNEQLAQIEQKIVETKAMNADTIAKIERAESNCRSVLARAKEN